MADSIGTNETWGGIRGKLNAPLLSLATPALQLMPQEIWDDVLSGDPQLDHTAYVEAVFTDTDGKRSIVFPDQAVFNVDHVRIQQHSVYTSDREIIFGGATFRKRQNFVPGDWAGFLRFYVPVDGGGVGQYGYWDGLKIEGGKFDQNGKTNMWHLALLMYLRKAKIRDLTIIHRNVTRQYVTLDNVTDTFQLVGGAPHGRINGDWLALETAAGLTPTGHPGSGTRFYVVNATSTEFKLSTTLNGSPVDFTSDGTNLFVVDYGVWATSILGRDIEIENLRVENGSDLYQDGIHIVGGKDIAVIGGYSESGDDLLACGSEIETFSSGELGLERVTVQGLRGKSNSAFAAKVYVSDPLRWVKHVYIDGLVASSGVIRNGGISIEDKTGTNPAEGDAPLINDVKINASLTLGSAGRTDTNRPNIIEIKSAHDVKITGSVEIIAGVDWSEGLITSCTNCDVSLERLSNNNLGASVLTDFISDNTLGNLDCNLRTKSRSAIPNPRALGATTGTGSGGAGPFGSQPTGWSVPSTATNGISCYRVKLKTGGFGVRITGTATAETTLVIAPHASATVSAAQGQLRRITGLMTLIKEPTELPASTIFKAVIRERTAANAFIALSEVTLDPLSALPAPFEISRKMGDPTAGLVQYEVNIVVASGAIVDFTVAMSDMHAD